MIRELNYSQSKGAYTLILTEFFDRFSFYGLTSVLVLILSSHFGLPEEKVYELYGAFITLSFLMPIIGGYITDKYFDHTQAIILGIIMIILGNLILITFNIHTFSLGLAFTIIGIGFLKANTSTLLGFLYKDQIKQKESSFIIFYIGMNIGAILGPIIYALVSLNYGWRYGFIIGAIGLACMLYFFKKRYRLFRSIETSKLNQGSIKSTYLKMILACCGATALALFISYILVNETVFEVTLLLVIIGLLIILARIISKEKKLARKHMLFFLILYIFTICYFACSAQVNSSIMFLIHNYLTQHNLQNKIPASISSSLEPFFVIAFGPIIIKILQTLLKNTTEINLLLLRVGLSLITAVLAFISFSIAAKDPTSISLFICLILLGNLFLGAGELLAAPALLSAVTYLIDKKYQSTFMGIWASATAFSGFISGLIGKVITKNSAVNFYSAYSHAFEVVTIIMIAITVIFIIFTPFIKKLI